jgi:hypothetical protein
MGMISAGTPSHRHPSPDALLWALAPLTATCNLGQMMVWRTVRPALDSLGIEHHTIRGLDEVAFVERTIRQAVRQPLERWRTVSRAAGSNRGDAMRFVCSCSPRLGSVGNEVEPEGPIWTLCTLRGAGPGGPGASHVMLQGAIWTMARHAYGSPKSAAPYDRDRSLVAQLTATAERPDPDLRARFAQRLRFGDK